MLKREKDTSLVVKEHTSQTLADTVSDEVEEYQSGALFTSLLCVQLLLDHLVVETLEQTYHDLSRSVFVNSDLLVLGAHVHDTLLHGINLLFSICDVAQGL